MMNKLFRCLCLFLSFCLFLCFSGCADESYDKGYDAGFEAGYEEGLSQGYDKGYKDGKNTESSSDYDAGYEAGYSDGHTDGVNIGYELGQEVAYSNPDSDGNEGRGRFITGFFKGYEAGFHDGENGVSDPDISEELQAALRDAGYSFENNPSASHNIGDSSSGIVPIAPSSTPAPAPSRSVPDTSQTVYITNTGTKYHRDGCGYLSKSKIAISLSDAKARGYTPCSRCW